MTTTKEFFDNLAPTWNHKETNSQSDILEFISKNIPLKKGMKTLDVGCGTGIISNALNKLTNEKVTAIDLSTEMISIAKKTHSDNIEFLSCNFYDFDRNGFDALVCFNAYPHFGKGCDFAKKASSILNQNGICAIIHNISREVISNHHKNLSLDFTRELLPVEEEVKAFEKYFNTIKLVDNNNYIMILQKK